ncbi:MAG: sigma-70 family RNA polymerase sigma factor [Clostridia bacterium]|nr:sigma-70 family RNA polymerase sigma factor [Clostridia bacterium]
MKKLTVTVMNRCGETECISAYVEDEVAEALEQCSDEVRRVYILDKHEEQNADRRETRRHCSLALIMEEGEQFGTNEYNPAVEMMKCEDNERLYEAMRTLTDKQYQALWRYAVDGLTFEEIGEEMGIRWETVREHYKFALKKLRKILRDTP